MRHRQPPASRTFASGTRSEDRSDRPGLPWSGYRAPVARSSVAGRRSPRKPAASRDREPTRRADALPNLVVSTSSSPRLPIPLLEPRARKRARTPARPTGLGRAHRAGGGTPAEQHTGPAVKTSGPRLPPRDAKRAVGGIRAWGENPGRRASSPTTVLPFWTFACADLKSLSARTSPRASANSPPTPAGPNSHGEPAPGSSNETTIRAERNANRDTRSEKRTRHNASRPREACSPPESSERDRPYASAA
jgi:hypothetical protein